MRGERREKDTRARFEAQPREPAHQHGFTALAIADRMGHEATDITFRYAHLFPNVQDDMANELEEERGGF